MISDRHLNKDSVTLGLGGSSHDFSAVLMINHDICIAIEEERLSRRKHGSAWWYQNPVGKSVQYCLDSANLSIKDVDYIVSSNLLPQRAMAAFASDRIKLYPHHLCHAASALLFSPHDTSVAIIVYDGMGSIRKREDHKTIRETFSFYLFDNNHMKCLGETVGASLWEPTDYPMGCSNSIGHFYELITMSLGFGEFQDGKTMGLAAHGTPRYLSELEKFIKLNEDINNCFETDPINSGIVQTVESILKKDRYSFSVKADMAASIQKVLEIVLQHCWKLILPYQPDVVAIVGGCGLNSVANGRLAAQLPHNVRLLIPPFPGDAGLGFGALWLCANEHRQGKAPHQISFRGHPITSNIARPGLVYSDEEILDAVRWGYPKVAIDAEIQGPQDIARLIANGKILGIFQAGSEIGPRALGRRSLMADCRSSATREYINRHIKKREPFRPLAPIVLRSRFEDFFTDLRQADEYMMKVATVRPDKMSLIPAVVHIDGTARVQVIDESIDPFITQILEELYNLTGIPMAINTSFNRRGEPMVETPRDAIDCFLGLGLDGLWLQQIYLFSPAE